MFCIALKYVSSACHSMKINYLCCDKTIIKIKYINLIFLAIVSNALPCHVLLSRTSECDYIFITMLRFALHEMCPVCIMDE